MTLLKAVLSVLNPPTHAEDADTRRRVTEATTRVREAQDYFRLLREREKLLNDTLVDGRS